MEAIAAQCLYKSTYPNWHARHGQSPNGATPQHRPPPSRQAACATGTVPAAHLAGLRTWVGLGAGLRTWVCLGVGSCGTSVCAFAKAHTDVPQEPTPRHTHVRKPAPRPTHVRKPARCAAGTVPVAHAACREGGGLCCGVAPFGDWPWRACQFGYVLLYKHWAAMASMNHTRD